MTTETELGDRWKSARVIVWQMAKRPYSELGHARSHSPTKTRTHQGRRANDEWKREKYLDQFEQKFTSYDDLTDGGTVTRKYQTVGKFWSVVRCSADGASDPGAFGGKVSSTVFAFRCSSRICAGRNSWSNYFFSHDGGDGDGGGGDPSKGRVVTTYHWITTTQSRITILVLQ